MHMNEPTVTTPKRLQLKTVTNPKTVPKTATVTTQKLILFSQKIKL